MTIQCPRFLAKRLANEKEKREAAAKLWQDNHITKRTKNAREQLVFDGIKCAMALAHDTATEAGWYTDANTGRPIERNVGEVIALMHSELSEALEADRKSLMDDKLPHRPGIEVELADLLLRVFDTARAKNLDLAGAIIEKNRYNRIREDHKIENRRNGGKRY